VEPDQGTVVKLLIDACISPRVAPRIAPLFASCEHVFECGGIADDDRLIWDYAKSNGFAILTKDSDFMHMSDVFKAPPKVVWLRVANAGTNAIADLVFRRIAEFKRFDADSEAALLIIDI
jgi:predicted nuclease of predicted toxin-antitoxin system